MDKTRKKRIKSIIGWCCLAALVVALTAMPLLAAEKIQEDGPAVVTHSAQASQGSVSHSLHLGGTLAAQEAEALTLPSGVKLVAYLVKNGDRVTQGQALARVDTVTVMEAITQVQDTLDYLDDQLSDVDSATGTLRLKAQTAGTVKEIYGKKGDSVRQVMLDHGALAIVSLDGKMALDIQTEEPLTIGQTLSVTLEGETVEGRVESRLGNTFILTLTDKGYAPETAATVATPEGVELGSGSLYIHNPWKVTAVSGTISGVNVKENEKVSQGRLLMTLMDTDTDAQRQTLLDRRQDYEETMQTLFRLYETGILEAPCDGLVAGVEEDSPLLLAAEGSWEIVLLANEGDPDNDDPDDNETGDNETGDNDPKPPDPTQPSDPEPTSYTGVVAVITGGEGGGLTFLSNGDSITIKDTAELTAAQKDVSTLTSPYPFGGTMYLYILSGGSLQLTATPAAAGQLVFITNEGQLISLGTVSSGQTPGQVPTVDMSGLLSGFGGMGGMTTAPSFEPYDLTETTALTVTPEESLTLEVPVDEQDISRLALDMEAEVSITALPGTTHTARVTKIGTAVNSGGNSKFTVTLTLDRGADMLPGMSASARLSLEGDSQGLVVPTAAITDDGTHCYVYTALEEKTGALAGKTQVTPGPSDGAQTLIQSGLTEGQTVYYTTYEPEENP